MRCFARCSRLTACTCSTLMLMEAAGLCEVRLRPLCLSLLFFRQRGEIWMQQSSRMAKDWAWKL